MSIAPVIAIATAILVATLAPSAAWAAAPVLLLWFAGSVPLATMIAATGTLAGYYTFRLLIFKAGVFEPIMSFRP